jgi:DNA-binding protein H-NS
MTTELDTLEQQIADLQAKKQAILNAQRDTRLQEVKAIVHQFGFTATDLGLATGTGKKASSATKTKLEAKYVNPKDATQTWHGGKGPRPHWVKDYLATGGELSAIAIKK